MRIGRAGRVMSLPNELFTVNNVQHTIIYNTQCHVGPTVLRLDSTVERIRNANIIMTTIDNRLTRIE